MNIRYRVTLTLEERHQLEALVRGGKGAVRACSPDCEDLYEEYLKPTYGVIGKDADHQG